MHKKNKAGRGVEELGTKRGSGDRQIGDKRERERVTGGVDDNEGGCMRRMRLGETGRSLAPREGTAIVG